MDFLASREFLSAVGFVCLFVIGWIAVVWTIGQLGWANFAALYPGPVKPQARAFLASQASVGGGLGGYRNVLTARFAPEGIHVQSGFPFNFGHRPILLPWQCLQAAQVDRTLFGKRLVVKLSCAAGELRMTLPWEAQAALEAARPK